MILNDKFLYFTSSSFLSAYLFPTQITRHRSTVTSSSLMCGECQAAYNCEYCIEMTDWSMWPLMLTV